jgi:hypothetical protein
MNVNVVKPGGETTAPVRPVGLGRLGKEGSRGSRGWLTYLVEHALDAHLEPWEQDDVGDDVLCVYEQ